MQRLGGGSAGRRPDFRRLSGPLCRAGDETRAGRLLAHRRHIDAARRTARLGEGRHDDEDAEVERCPRR